MHAYSPLLCLPILSIILNMPSSSPALPLVFSSIPHSFLLYLLFLLLSPPFLLSTTWNTPHKTCLQEHFTALLDLKRGFDLEFRSVTNLSSWNTNNTDCCSWEGISCNISTGHVTSLNLSGFFISGSFHFESLFRLRSLQRLDLSENFFYESPIPSGFNQLPNLTHLHLSGCYFSGQIPVDIFSLTRLVSLDLSYNNEHCFFYLKDCGSVLSFKNPGISGLLRNLSSLRELHLDLVDLSDEATQWNRVLEYAPPNLQKLSMSYCRLSGPIIPPHSPLRLITYINLDENDLWSPVPDIIANFTSLTYLSLGGCGLHGEFPRDIFNLPRIQYISISGNPFLTGYLPDFSSNSSIQNLIMRETGFSGKLTPSLGNLKFLSYLDVSDCHLSGPIPQSFVNLIQLVYLDLTNNSLSGPISSTLFSLPSLRALYLSRNHFSGELGRSRNSSSSELYAISLNDNHLQGPVSSSLFELAKLLQLDLSWNNFSSIQLYNISASHDLEFLNLENNNFQGPIPGLLFEFTERLSLSSNNFSSIEFRNLSSQPLYYLSLDRNNFHGPIPKIIFELKELSSLNLSSNSFSGVMDFSLFHNHTTLSSLDLSYNSLTTISDTRGRLMQMSFPQLRYLNLRSCNINKFPDGLRNQMEMKFLDLSGNEIRGKIPQWIWKVTNVSFASLNLSQNAFEEIEGPLSVLTSIGLDYLDLSSNKLKGSTPVPPSFSKFFSISNNQFSGDVPSQICNATKLEVMDLSNNNLSGQIPECFGEMSDVLAVLKLGGNNFNSTLLQAFRGGCNLRTIALNGNRLEGQLPVSLANCKKLEALDLGNNQIYDGFPVWLKSLPQLRVLVLRSNQFHGTLGYHPTMEDFPQLQIFDVSFNKFTGRLPSDMFKYWKAMTVSNKSEALYLGDRTQTGIYYEDTVTVVAKGNEMQLNRILRAFTLLDLSNNKFEGILPTSVGNLKSLHIINMSHNGFTGGIPASMGDIKQLESLDLSQNELSGKIPWQLTKLPWLAVLNLSENHLEGSIPQGPQFDTFTDESFKGNSGLCGPPLSNKCEDDQMILPPAAAGVAESESEYDWEIIWIGFGIGHGVGLGILLWTLVLWRKGRIALFILADRVLLILLPPGTFSFLQRCTRNPRNARPRLKN